MNKEEREALYEVNAAMRELDCEYTLPSKLEKIEKDEIQNALYETDGNQTLAAKKLGIGRTCLIAKMKKLGITV
jgi:DNA-binding NtrC family response regulator